MGLFDTAPMAVGENTSFFTSATPSENKGLFDFSPQQIDNFKTAGGLASSVSNMGIGGIVGAGIGSFGGPMGTMIGGTLGGLVDKGLSSWLSNKRARAQRRYLEKQQAIQNKFKEAEMAQNAEQFKMNYALQKDQFGLQEEAQAFNQTQNRAQFRINSWNSYLNNLRSNVQTKSNLRNNLIQAGMI